MGGWNAHNLLKALGKMLNVRLAYPGRHLPHRQIRGLEQSHRHMHFMAKHIPMKGNAGKFPNQGTDIVSETMRCHPIPFDRTEIDAQLKRFGSSITALDERIKAGYSVGAFNSRGKHCLCDWSYPSSAYSLQDAEVAALCAPRRLYIQIGMDDTVFDYRSAVAEAEWAMAYYRQLGAENAIHFDLCPGGHTLSDHEEGFDFLFESLK